jgi:hypothetical protein
MAEPITTRNQVLHDVAQRAAALPPADPAVPVESIIAARLNGLRFTGAGAREILVEIAARALVAVEEIDVRRATAPPRARPVFQ